MNLRSLVEEWKDYVEVDYKDRTYSIYINPNTKDFLKLKKEDDATFVRYILGLYSDFDLYVFSSDVLHYFAAQKLGITYKERVHLPVWGDYAFGESPIINGNKLELSKDVLTEIKRMGRNVPPQLQVVLNKYFVNAPQKPEKKERRKLFRS